MAEDIFYSPPVIFIIIFLTALLLFLLASVFAFRNKNKQAGSGKAYACGEDFQGHLIQPDYSEFFPFIFFFTILHVIALVIATIPAETVGTFAMAVVYIAGAVTGLTILLRK